MATSGSYSWTLNRDAAIKGALRKLGVLASGATPTAAQISDCSDALNAIIKAFQADGMPLWAIESYTFTPTAGTQVYTIGSGKTLNLAYAPMKIIQGLYTVYQGENVPMNIYNRYDFQNLPTMHDSGIPINLYYQPIDETSGVIQLWPNPNNSTTQITFDYQRPFADMNSATDAFDFPAYWLQALIYNLAWSMAPEYGMPVQDRQTLAAEAKFWKEEALSYGSEEGSMFFQPSRRF